MDGTLRAGRSSADGGCVGLGTRRCCVEDDRSRNQTHQSATDDVERLRAICREEAGLDPVRLKEVRRRRCLEHFRERVRAISRLGVEARRRKAAERRAAQENGAGIGLGDESRQENAEVFAHYDALTAPCRDEPTQSTESAASGS